MTAQETSAYMLARAFANDAALHHIFRDVPDAARRRERLFALFLTVDAKAGFVTSGGGGTAIALWRPPGAPHPSIWTMLRYGLEMASIFGTALPRALAMDRAIQQHQPKSPFWYLHVLGCAPESRRRGFGREAVEKGLERFTCDGRPCFLETAAPNNLPFYEGLGFEVVDEWSVLNGPPFWSMLRPAELA